MVLVDADKRASEARRRAANERVKVRRNDRCRCGSGKKYKSCCLENDQQALRQRCAQTLPPWLHDSPKKLHQFEKYACKVYGIAAALHGVGDGRRDPNIPVFDVLNSLFHAALLRIPSFNALIGDLAEADFQMLLGKRPRQDRKLFTHKVLDNTLDKIALDDLHHLLPNLVFKAERNKAFREGGYGTLRLVAIDGWEPFCSYKRHCPHCLVRKVKVKRKDGEVEKVDPYYHRYVVALMVDPVLDVVLAVEPVRNGEARRQDGEDEKHEGELTAAHRLIDRLKEAYGSFIDGFVMDALYANGPVMTRLDKHGYGALIVLKKEDQEPLKEALDLWNKEPPCRSVDDLDKKEHIDFWDVDDVDTLDTYKGKVRVVRAVVSDDKGGAKGTWCFAAVGPRMRKLGLVTALKAMRSKWHIENTCFNQWVQHWNLSHVFHHTSKALMAILLLWSLVFDLLQLFVYRRLGRERRPKDHADTIRHLVEVMMRDVATIPEAIPWEEILAPG